jgi:hypothetical protein
MTYRLSTANASDGLLLDNPAEDVVEIPLLLQGWQMTALETAAHRRGLTAGEMVRDLLRDFLSRLSADSSDAVGTPFEV